MAEPPAIVEVLDEPAGVVPAGVEAAAEVVPPPVVWGWGIFSFRFCFLVLLVFVFSATYFGSLGVAGFHFVAF